MLTKNDLQQIRGVVNDEIVTALKPVKRNVDKLYKDFHTFVDYFDKHLSKVKRDVKKLQQN